jgi:D-xylose 1-dehydrogenase (NADP+, D-xylono-1,5-lactone-forming)
MSPADQGARPVRIGLAGCGGISHSHARAAAGIPDVDIVACCDVSAGVAEAWAERYGCERAYPDLDALLGHELDAVLLSTWPSQHHDQVLNVLDRGVRNILCEKALATTGRDAYEMWAAARRSDALLVEGFMYRHHPATRELERRLAAGDLGDLAHVRATFTSLDPGDADPHDDTRDWRLRPESGGGVPFDLTCYGVDSCNHFNPGLPIRVSALGGTSARYRTVDRLYALIEYSGGTYGVIESTRRGGFGQGISVTCAGGHLFLPQTWIVEGPTDVREQRSEGWRTVSSRSTPVPEADFYRLQLENFAAAVRGDERPRVDLAESVVGIFTIQAALESLASGAAVRIELPDDVVADLPAARAGVRRR